MNKFWPTPFLTWKQLVNIAWKNVPLKRKIFPPCFINSADNNNEINLTWMRSNCMFHVEMSLEQGCFFSCKATNCRFTLLGFPGKRKRTWELYVAKSGTKLWSSILPMFSHSHDISVDGGGDEESDSLLYAVGWVHYPKSQTRSYLSLQIENIPIRLYWICRNSQIITTSMKISKPNAWSTEF